MIISNSTPLVHLAALGDFHLLRTIFHVIHIPDAVHEEVVASGAGFPVGEAVQEAVGDWIHVLPVDDRSRVKSIAEETKLDLGEAEAIALYQQESAVLLLVDERRAVRHARQAGIRIMRTPMVFAEAKRLGLIASFREKLEQLRQTGFWLSDRDLQIIVQQVEES